MKTKFLFLTLFCVCVACKKTESTGTNESNDVAILDTASASMDSVEVTADSSAVTSSVPVEAIDSNSNFEKLRTKIKSDPKLFETENIYTSIQKLNDNKISLPDAFMKSNFLEDTGTGLEIDKIIGNIVKIKAKEDNISIEELKNFYVLVGITNWFFRIAQYEESNLKGSFSYAINIDGKKYANTSYKKTEYKIAVNAQPLSNFIKITK